MDSLLHKLGLPPYRLDQIVALLDEASAFSSNSKENSKHHYDDAVHIAESLEALAWLVEVCLSKLLPQFVMKPDPVSLKLFGPVSYTSVLPSERDVLDSIGPRTSKLKDWMFDSFQEPSQTSCPALGTAELCQHCNWPFQRLARGPVKSVHLPELSPLISRASPRYLLTVDDWPNFPVLEKRSLQGCHFCLLLRENLLSLFTQRPGVSDLQRVLVWIKFCWDQDKESLGSVIVFLRGVLHLEKSLDFTIYTTSGELYGRELSMI